MTKKELQYQLKQINPYLGHVSPEDGCGHTFLLDGYFTSKQLKQISILMDEFHREDKDKKVQVKNTWQNLV